MDSMINDLANKCLEWWEEEGTGEAPDFVRMAMHIRGGKWGSGPWWCCECNKLVESNEVTHEEFHENCGGLCY